MDKKKLILISKVAVGIFLACIVIFWVASSGQEEIMVKHGVGVIFFALMLVSGIVSVILLLIEAVFQTIVMYKLHGFKAIVVVLTELLIVWLAFFLIDKFVFGESQSIIRYLVVAIVIVAASQATTWWKNNKKG